MATAPSLPVDNPRLYADLWARIGAGTVDLCICLLLMVAVLFGLSAALGSLRLAPADGELPDIVFGLAYLTVPWLYDASMTASIRGATVGKLAFRLRTVRGDGGPVGFWIASGRYWAKTVSLLPLGAGYLPVAVSARGQALHDMLADTAVIRMAPRPER